MTTPLDVRALWMRIHARLERTFGAKPEDRDLLRDASAAIAALEQERDRLRKALLNARDLAESDDTNTVGSAWTYLEQEIASWPK